MQIPPEIDRVVARALAKDPEHRYQSARKFAAALKRILEGKPPEDPDEVLPNLPPPLPASQPSNARAEDNEAEKEFWNEVKDSNDPEDLALYIEQFPRGKFVGLAKEKMAALRSGNS